MNIIPHNIVYITNNSNKYHYNKHCSGIKNVTEIDLERALDNGYVPCKRCFKNN
jgi:hypothetical protein